MHIAALLMIVMARPSCTTVRLFGASHCHMLPLRPALPWGCGPPGGGGGPSLGDHPPGGGGGPSSLGWGTTRGGEGTLDFPHGRPPGGVLVAVIAHIVEFAHAAGWDVEQPEPRAWVPRSSPPQRSSHPSIRPSTPTLRKTLGNPSVRVWCSPQLTVGRRPPSPSETLLAFSVGP